MSIKTQNHPAGVIIKKNYSNGQLAVFYQDYDGEPIAELSVNENSVELVSNEFILKNYSENACIAKEFLKTKIFIPTNRFVLIGSNLCPVCNITV